ncbi:hypothetical protein SAMN05428949_7213 [Chitinophaga sp. YR627]|uniref:hypothetical protein n=1 Tax=Chitinophaga sp. YR627 TaxID=1881041 RepID=UPI0008DFA96E|nr:hypothetical protein [Chitinophaga sp. YR627]SFP04927.1 hypothetical protein SAMN05428949_7213 [Chitinophaga sp. YR627]
METVTSMERRLDIYSKYGFTIDYNMQDYRDAPFFKKKLAQAEANLARCPIPSDLIELAKKNRNRLLHKQRMVDGLPSQST